MSATTYNISVEQGATFYLTVTYKDSAGIAIDLTGYTAAMQIRDQPGGKVYLTASTTNGKITVNNLGVLSVVIPAADTARLSLVNGVYDLFLSSPAGADPVYKLLAGDAEIIPAVTKT